MEVGPERTRHERDAVVHGWSAQISETEVDPVGDAGLASALRADLQHPGRGVDADHVHPGRRGGDRDPSRADAELDDRAGRGDRLVDIERDVLDHTRAPRVVQASDRVVGAHAS